MHSLARPALPLFCALAALLAIWSDPASAQDGGATAATSFCTVDPFDGASLDAGWTVSGVGDADDGSATLVGGKLRIASDGSSLYHGADHGTFVHRTVPGNLQAEVDFSALAADGGGTYRKACLTARSSLDPLAARVMVCVVPGHPTGPAVYFDVRTTDGGQAEELGSIRDDLPVPQRLALVRRGAAVTVSFLDDTGEWVVPAGALGGTVDVALGPSPEVGI
ncbi:MAG: hypothetical protein AAGD06_29800, partial [Acidobacteriota bacterium]